MEAPATFYASADRGQIAYQVLGEGDRDILYLRGLGNVEVQWDVEPLAKFLYGLASFGRLIVFDRRGSGASDPIPLDAIPTWEEWADDALVVLDAVGSDKAVVLGEIDAGPIAVVLAASHPQRVDSLVLMTTAAKYMQTDDYPIGVPEETVVGFVDLIRESWGSDELIKLAMPSLADDDETGKAMTKFVRLTATPRTAAAQYDYVFRNNDTRSVLSAIQAPTLVMHRADSVFVPVGLGRFLAENIAGARLVEIPGQDLYFFGDNAELALDEIAEFVTGEVPSHDPARILATVLFTDIVSSTEQATTLGDRDWSLVLDAHNAIVRRELARHRGREVGTAGDGFLATFDGPTRAIRCACAIRDALRALDLDVRAGVHTGEIETRGADVSGIAVHIGARVAATADAGEVLVSRTVADLVAGSSIEFESRGEHALKGVPGSWALFAVTAS